MVQAQGGAGTIEAPADAPTAARVGDKAPDFALRDTQDEEHKLSAYLGQGKPIVLEWFNPGCPFVQKYHAGDNPALRDALVYATEHDVVWLAVNSGAPGRQGHGVEVNEQARAEFGMGYPVLLDEDGTVGRAYGATNTPQLFIISTDGLLLYNGGVDDTLLADDQASVNFAKKALREHLSGEVIEFSETPHPGCSVKYAN
jgi:peroxiredoxin